MGKKRKKVSEVKARLLVAIGDRLEESANGLQKCSEPCPNAQPGWQESMQLHYGQLCSALLDMFESVESMDWPVQCDSDPHLKKALIAFRTAAAQAVDASACGDPKEWDEAGRLNHDQLKKACSAVDLVWDTLWPFRPGPPAERIADGTPQTTQ